MPPGRPSAAASVLVVLTAAMFTMAPYAANADDFLPVKRFPVGKSPYAIAAADLNRDGVLDLATANEFGMLFYPTYAGSFSVLLGTGGQGFAPQAEYAIRPTAQYYCPNGITTGDFNGDGLPDVAVANYFNYITVFYGQSGGGFGAPERYASGNGTHSIVAADFNRDGRLDLAATNIYSNSITVLYGMTSGGGFGTRRDFAVGDYPEDLVAADLNGDGVLDLACANEYGGNISVLNGEASGSFGPSQCYTVGAWPRGISSADYNRDGRADVAVSNRNSNTVSILYGQGDGTLGGREDYQVGNNSWGVATADLNADGLPDLVIANEQYSDSLTVYYGLSSGGFGGRVDLALPSGSLPRGVVLGDFDKNGGIDIATGTYWDNYVNVFYNVIPEPATLCLLTLGGLAVLRGRRK